MPYCLTCGAGVDEFDSAYYARNMLCIPCYVRKSSEIAMASCSRCGTRVRQEEARRKGGMLYCGYCFSELERLERIPVCPLCSKKMEDYQRTLRLSNGKKAHLDCATAPSARVRVFCSTCGKETDYFRVSPAGIIYCIKCDKAGAAGTPGAAEKGVQTTHDHPFLESLVGRIGAMLG
jgi:late competence protein required for DNA uptake (superfamily II DNA/RNA helicase)